MLPSSQHAIWWTCRDKLVQLCAKAIIEQAKERRIPIVIDGVRALLLRGRRFSLWLIVLLVSSSRTACPTSSVSGHLLSRTTRFSDAPLESFCAFISEWR